MVGHLREGRDRLPPLRTGDWSRTPSRIALVDPLRPAAPLLVAQDELLDLARRGLGEVPELDGGGTLEARNESAAKRDDVLLRRARARLERHEGLGAFSPLLVGHRHHRAFENGRVARDRLLHLDRGDVLAARDYDVLL